MFYNQHALRVWGGNDGLFGNRQSCDDNGQMN